MNTTTKTPSSTSTTSANGTGPGAAGQSQGAGKPSNNPKTAEYWQHLLSLGYHFRLNVLDDSIEVNGAQISDVLAAEIKNAMQDRGFRNVGRIERAWTGLAYRNQYHPVKEYLDSLKWSGQPAITKLASYLTFAPDCHVSGVNYGEVFLRRWLIGAVAKAVESGQNFMLVFEGDQDIGKSHFVRWLCPIPDLFIEGSINTDDKDSLLRLISKFVWEVAELQNTTRKSDRAALKDFITKNIVTVRKSYGRYDLNKPALANFIGTINPEGSGFLDDPSGNRRFVIVPLMAIDWAYSEKVDVNDVWAEAYQLYQAGEPWRLSGEEKTIQKLLQQGYEATSTLEDMLAMTYEYDPQWDEWTPGIDMLREVEIEFGHTPGSFSSNRDKAELGRVMAKWRVPSKRMRHNTGTPQNPKEGTGQVTCYHGIKKRR